MNKRIVYIHIPKCGGSSVARSLKKSLGYWDLLRRNGIVGIKPKESKKASEYLNKPLQEFRKELLVYYLSSQKNQYVEGHVGINKFILEEFVESWDFITILRDPVERYYSEFFYNKYKKEDHFNLDVSFEEYLNSDLGRSNGKKYLSYFSEDLKLNQAKENLRKFRIVGFLDNLDSFQQVFKDAYGKKLSIPHRNSNPASEKKKEKTVADTLEKVKKVCTDDIELFNWATETFSKKISNG